MHCARVLVLNVVSNDTALFPARLYHQWSTHSLCRWCRRLWIWRSPGLRLVSSRRLHPLVITLLMTQAVPNGTTDDATNNEAHAMITMTIPSASVLSFLPAVALWGHTWTSWITGTTDTTSASMYSTCLANAWLLTIIITIAVSVLMSLSSAYVIR